MAASNRAIIALVLIVNGFLAGCAGTGGELGTVPIEDRGAARTPPSSKQSTVGKPPVARALPLPDSQTPAPALPVVEEPPAGAEAPTVIAKAEQTYRPPKPSDPAVQSLVKAAREAAARGEWERAQAALERALKLDSDDASLWTQLAYTHFRRGDLDQAKELAERGLVQASTGNQDDAATRRLLQQIEAARSQPDSVQNR
jgi:Tetratricopeptide repeat